MNASHAAKTLIFQEQISRWRSSTYGYQGDQKRHTPVAEPIAYRLSHSEHGELDHRISFEDSIAAVRKNTQRLKATWLHQRMLLSNSRRNQGVSATTELRQRMLMSQSRRNQGVSAITVDHGRLNNCSDHDRACMKHHVFFHNLLIKHWTESCTWNTTAQWNTHLQYIIVRSHRHPVLFPPCM